MIFSPMSTINRTSLSPSFVRKRDLPTPPPSLSDVNDSSSCSSSYSTTTTSTQSDHTTVVSCDLLSILTDIRFRPVFQAIDDIKRRKCRPDLERILKHVTKRYPTKNPSDQRNEILVILEELLKYGIITKVFHKGGFTIRIKNEKYAKLIENINLCSNQKSPTMTTTMTTTQETPSISLFEPQAILHSNDNHKRETPSPEFGMFQTEEFQMTKENNFTSNKKRARSRTDSSAIRTKKSRLNKTLDSHEDHTRKPLVTNHNLPPVTIEQLLGLRGDIPDVHHWTINDLNEFFHQQGYEYASIVLNQHQINGDKLYQLTREQVFRLSTLKIGKALKLWNVVEQIQRNNLSSSL